ncbi:MAG: aryl-sulfate sulfotransferase [Chthoniobacterales bacterium]
MSEAIIVVTAIFSLVCGGDSLAVQPAITVDGITPGFTPFVSFISFKVTDPANLSSVGFSITPKRGSQTRALGATYTRDYLQNAGYFQPRNGRVTLPVFGLYQNFRNSVTVLTTFSDGTNLKNKYKITTAAYDGGTYTSPTILQPRLQNTTLSFDFILLKGTTQANTPVIVDSDAEVQWGGSAGGGGQHSIFFDNAIYYGQDPASLVRQEFDGRSQILGDYSSLGATHFHHNFDYGRDGIIMAVDTNAWVESVNIEVDGAGNVLKVWNMADILSAAMIAGGDNPAQFVFPAPSDWFHNNACAYRLSDDSFVVSGREDFVIALDYDTSAIKWILGDSTKHWYQFNSLKVFALALGPDTLAPIGEHAISFFQDELLLFDNGTASLTQQPPGDNRTYSAPRRYSIANNTATEVWHYLANPSIKSSFCSSVYEDMPNNYLIDYTQANNLATDLRALDATGNVVFEYQYVQDGCGSAWNAVPIHLENLQFQ